jgi:hypothetical protein
MQKKVWAFIVERGPAAGLWLLAMAAQLSGYSNAAAALFLAGLAALFLVAPGYHHVAAWFKKRATQGSTVSNAQMIILASLAGIWLFMTIGLGAAAWMAATARGFAIGQSAIGVGAKEDEGPMVWYRGPIIEGAAYGRNLFSLTFRGSNISQKEVELRSASIISAINGTKIQLEIIAQGESVPLNQVELIPPGAPVQLVAKFGPPDPNAPGKILGLEPKIFLESWRQFFLSVQDDSQSYRMAYNEGDLAPFFPGMVGPHVSRKAAPTGSIPK